MAQVTINFEGLTFLGGPGATMSGLCDSWIEAVNDDWLCSDFVHNPLCKATYTNHGGWGGG